jgi:hypothetical protein
MRKLNLSTFHYTSFPEVGKEVLLNKVWEQGRTLQFRTVRARVLSVGPKRMRVRTLGHKRYTLFADPAQPYTVYTNPGR